MGVVFRDLPHFVRLQFNSVSVSFAPRTCNSVSHALLAAIGANGNDPHRLCLAEVPSDVRDFVASDLGFFFLSNGPPP